MKSSQRELTHTPPRGKARGFEGKKMQPARGKPEVNEKEKRKTQAPPAT